MPLTMRPSGLGAGIDKDRQDFTIYSGEWAIGRIYETRGGPDRLRWFWVVHRHLSDDALRSCVNLGGGQGAIRDSLAAMAGVGEAA